MIHSCPACESPNMQPVRREEQTTVYSCPSCQHSVETVEVLSSELRRLVMSSLELVRLQLLTARKPEPMV